MLSSDPKAARARVSPARWVPQLPLCLGVGGLQLAVSVSELRVEPRRRPLDGSSVVVKPPQAQLLREALGEGTRPRGSFSEKQSQLLS